MEEFDFEDCHLPWDKDVIADYLSRSTEASKGAKEKGDVQIDQFLTDNESQHICFVAVTQEWSLNGGLEQKGMKRRLRRSRDI